MLDGVACVVFVLVLVVVLDLVPAEGRRSDPYLVLERNGEKVFETSHRMQTQHPYWNDVYVL